MKKLSHTKWYLNGEGNPATGKEVVVDFSPSKGVRKIEVYAVQKGEKGKPDLKIDITEAEVQGSGFDATVEAWCDWDSKYAEEQTSPRHDQYWNRAKAIAKFHAQSFRH